MLFCTTAILAQGTSGVQQQAPAKPKTTAPPPATINKVVQDSLRIKDSLARVFLADSIRRDSLAQAIAKANRKLTWEEDTLFTKIFDVPYLPVKKDPVFMLSQERIQANNDYLFYLLLGLVAFLAFIKVTFPKYFHHIFTIFRQASFRQKQTSEQMHQDKLPGFLMNLLFILVGSAFVSVVVSQKNLVKLSFWELFLYSNIAFIAIYLGKYLFIRFAGWVFNVQESADIYAFIVFLVNKMIGVVLLPLLLVMAYSSGQTNGILLTVSLFVVGGLLIYRYIMSLSRVTKNLQISPFHFFIYLCGVEIIPLLLIYKVLFNKIGFSI